MNTTLETVSRFITSVSFGKRVLTRFSVARKHCIKFHLKLRDLEKNLSSSFLVQSDQLVLVLHFSLVPVYTVEQPASYVIVRLRGPSRVAMLSAKCINDWLWDNGLTPVSSISS